MADKEEGYAVLLSDLDSLQFQPIANVLGQFRKMPFQDSIRIARNCWGIVLDKLPEKEAEDLMVRLNAAGLKSYVTRPSLLAALPTLHPIKKAVIEPGGLLLPMSKDDPGLHAYKDPNAPKGPESIAWSRVDLIAAAGINVTEYSKIKVKEGPDAADRAINMGILLATGLPIKVGKKERMVEHSVESTELMFFLDIVLKDPAVRLRIDVQNFDFSGLKERKVYNVLGNLKLFLGDLVKAAPGAMQNRGARVLLGNKPVREMGYLTLEDLDKETRWLLTLVRRSAP